MHENSFGPVIKKINEEIERQANEGIRKYNITLAQARLILFLCECPQKSASQKELENFLQVSHPTTVTIIRSMETKKIVETYFDDSDRRMKIVRLIWGNDAVYRELIDHAMSIEARLLEGFSDDEKQLFMSFMKRACANIKG